MEDEKFKDNTVNKLVREFSESEGMLAMNARIRELKLELGKEKSYVAELEHEKKLLNEKNDQKDALIQSLQTGDGLEYVRKKKQQALLDDRVKELDTRCNNLKKRNKNLEDANRELVMIVRAANKWIDVEHARPEDFPGPEIVVIVSCKAGEDFRMRTTAIRDNDGRWWNGKKQLFSVTHFMFMPDNP